MCISDFAVSSYAPTIETLLTPPTSIPISIPTINPFKMTVIIQPKTTGYSPLPCTVDELQRIKEQVPTKWLVNLGTLTAPASVEAVLSHLPTSSVVHFACHGDQNLENPLKSALVLNNGQLTVSKIMEQPMPNASLAFLSACQTAMGDENLPDEAIHLAATLLFAGFRGAVGTMW